MTSQALSTPVPTHAIYGLMSDREGTHKCLQALGPDFSYLSPCSYQWPNTLSKYYRLCTGAKNIWVAEVPLPLMWQTRLGWGVCLTRKQLSFLAVTWLPLPSECWEDAGDLRTGFMACWFPSPQVQQSSWDLTWLSSLIDEPKPWNHRAIITPRRCPRHSLVYQICFHFCIKTTSKWRGTIGGGLFCWQIKLL